MGRYVVCGVWTVPSGRSGVFVLFFRVCFGGSFEVMVGPSRGFVGEVTP